MSPKKRAQRNPSDTWTVEPPTEIAQGPGTADGKPGPAVTELLEQSSSSPPSPLQSIVRALLVADQPVVRAGLRAVLERNGDIRIEGEAGDAPTAIELGQMLQPDVAVLDAHMLPPDGFDIGTELRNVSASTRLVFLGTDFTSRDLERGVAVGACAFILKSEPTQQLAALIRNVHEGEYCCSDPLSHAIVREPGGFGIARRDDVPLNTLTERERQLLCEIGRGSSLKQAASSIGCTYKTADYLKQCVMKKLNLHDRVELARFALRERLIS